MRAVEKVTYIKWAHYESRRHGTKTYVETREDEVADLTCRALQGVSVLYASGDSGVANRYNAGYPNSCLNADELYVDINGTRFSPSFPATCPYITSGKSPPLPPQRDPGASRPAPPRRGAQLTRTGQVGGTTLIGNDTSSGERAVADYGSGGGFSNVFGLPPWQASAVGGFLSRHAPDHGPGVYNDSGAARGFPDVAAIGLGVATVFDGVAYGVGGTSASAPIFAGVVTLLNEARIAAGKGPVGFLNPTLYANPGALNDVTVGSNPGCGTGGFNAAPGWDPVTGLGTPDFLKLKEVFLALP